MKSASNLPGKPLPTTTRREVQRNLPGRPPKSDRLKPSSHFQGNTDAQEPLEDVINALEADLVVEKRCRNVTWRPRRKKKSLCPKIRSKSEVIHDTSDALEAKETLEAVLEVVSELPKTLEATRGRLVLEKFEKLCR